MTRNGPRLDVEASRRLRDQLGMMVEETAPRLGRQHRAITALLTAADELAAATEPDPAHRYGDHTIED